MEKMIALRGLMDKEQGLVTAIYSQEIHVYYETSERRRHTSEMYASAKKHPGRYLLASYSVSVS